MRFINFILLFLIPSIALAQPKGAFIAEVVKLRGEATQLSPGAHMARVVSLGDKFVEDTSVVTGPKSFLKIKFVDNSEMNVGPESKIVIAEMKTDSVGVISLLKGRIRTEVKKDAATNGNKFFIKTRTAALGVRGTDFQTIYNPDNKMTSLLTYKGEVAMARVDEKTYDKLEDAPKVEVQRDDVTKGPTLKEVPAKKLDEVSELNKILKSNQAVVVPPGQNSFASDSLKKASLPVKISPVQLEVLYKNKDLEEKAAANINTMTEAEKTIKPTLKTADQIAPLEGVFNEKTGDFAPKAGGFIDINTGLYVAPDPSAQLDKETGVYVSTKVGDIDADTGQYVAPKGLVLDAQKGFVLESEADKKPELLALKEDLNKTIAKDIVVGDLDEVEIPFNLSEKFIRDRVAISLWNVNQNIKLNGNRGGVPFLELDSKRSARLGLLWTMSTNSRFAPIVGVDYGVVNLEGGGASQGSKKTFALSYGLQYAFTKKVNFFGKIGLHQEHFADQTTSTYPYSYDLKKITLTRITAGANAEFWRGRKWSVDASFAGLFTFRKKINNIIINNGSGFIFEVLPKFELKDHQWLGLGLNFENQLQRIEGSASLAQNKQERETGGLILKYIADF